MSDSPSEPSFADRVVRLFPAHRLVFIGLLSTLTAGNLWSGPPWWTFWPMIAAAVLFTLHYMILKVVTADESWADRRADEISERSYDLSHVTSITERYTRPPKPRRHPPPSTPTGDGKAPPG